MPKNMKTSFGPFVVEAKHRDPDGRSVSFFGSKKTRDDTLRIQTLQQDSSRWWFQFDVFSTLLGEDYYHFDSYFSKGLRVETTN